MSALPTCPTNSREWHRTPQDAGTDDAGNAISAPAAPQPFGTNAANRLYCRWFAGFVNPLTCRCAALGSAAPNPADSAAYSAALVAAVQNGMPQSQAEALATAHGLNLDSTTGA